METHSNDNNNKHIKNNGNQIDQYKRKRATGLWPVDKLPIVHHFSSTEIYVQMHSGTERHNQQMNKYGNGNYLHA